MILKRRLQVNENLEHSPKFSESLQSLQILSEEQRQNEQMREILKNAATRLFPNIGFDAAENGPRQVCCISRAHEQSGIVFRH